MVVLAAAEHQDQDLLAVAELQAKVIVEVHLLPEHIIKLHVEVVELEQQELAEVEVLPLLETVVMV
jgi:hypothetical protein